MLSIDLRSAAHDAAQQTLAASMGLQSLTRWGRKISDGGIRGGKRFNSWWECLFEVNGVKCPWEGSRPNLKKHLEGSVVKPKKGGRGTSLAGHGLKISS